MATVGRRTIVEKIVYDAMVDEGQGQRMPAPTINGGAVAHKVPRGGTSGQAGRGRDQEQEAQTSVGLPNRCWPWLAGV